jgi:hypothetical protein
MMLPPSDILLGIWSLSLLAICCCREAFATVVPTFSSNRTIGNHRINGFAPRIDQASCQKSVVEYHTQAGVGNLGKF